jgi:hypothetical protein
LATFAKLYGKKDDSAKLFMKKAWGDNFYDEESKKWYDEPVNDKG